MKKRVIAIALPALLAILFVGWAHLPRQVAPVEVMIEPGAASSHIARQLKAAGVIDSPLLFRLWARVSGRASRLQSGYYLFEGELAVADVLAKLARGEVMRFRVTAPEGLRSDEILDKLAQDTGVALAQWQQALAQVAVGEREGILLPETYTYTKPLDPAKLLGEMVAAQQRLLDSLAGDPERQQRLRIVASIIEKETSVDAERPLVSAVIRNRLQKGMPLQMDPTVIYGIWRRDGEFSGNLHKRDLSTDTLWNSYTRRGLPPTPICNPGAASIRAAASPADVDYLYFVANGSGGHAFASTLEEHNANVDAWVRIEQQR